MANQYVNKIFYESIIRFDYSDEAQDHYYTIMDTPIGKRSQSGAEETVRNQILRVYAMLFCDDLNLQPGQEAGPDEVEATADRLYVGAPSFDPQHWYRMQHHFPVIDEDNYDRFAALVVADLSAGPLHEAAITDGSMLLLGEKDPLHMTEQQRRNQKISVVSLEEGGVVL